MQESEMLVDLGSDQTAACPYGVDCYPVRVTYKQAKKMISSRPEEFKVLVQASL